MKIYKITEASKYLGISINSLKILANNGKLNSFKTVSGELWGEISGLRGDCTDIIGNLDDCELTDEERKKGVNIQDLII